MYAASLLTAPSLSDRLALILAGLRAAVAARMARNPALVPLLTLLWSRLHRAAIRFARVVHAPAVPAVAPAPARVGRPSGPPDRLPRGAAWLLRLVPEAAAYGTQLRALMDTPEMSALLAAHPRALRILRPLCRLLAVSPTPPAPRARTVVVAEPVVEPHFPADPVAVPPLVFGRP